jgi:sugar phosphate isomerase/epimerase
MIQQTDKIHCRSEKDDCPSGKSAFILILILIVMGLYGCSLKMKDDFLSGIGVCTSFNNAQWLEPMGYSYIEESVSNFLVPLESEATFNKILKNVKNSVLPVYACNSFIPGGIKCVGPNAVSSEVLKYMKTAFSRAQRAGVKYIVFGSGGSRSIPDGFSRMSARDQFISLCSSMAIIAANYNVVVVLEPLNKTECNFINSVAEGAEIVEEVNHPNFRLLADIYHLLIENESAEIILKKGHLIKHVHIAEKKDRAAPGTNQENLKPYFNALRKIGYRGKISVECKWTDMESQATIALETIKNQK